MQRCRALLVLLSLGAADERCAHRWLDRAQRARGDERRDAALEAAHCVARPDRFPIDAAQRVGAALANVFEYATAVPFLRRAASRSLVDLGKAYAYAGDVANARRTFAEAAHTRNAAALYEWARATELVTEEPLARVAANFSAAAASTLARWAAVHPRAGGWARWSRTRTLARGADGKRVVLREQRGAWVVGNDGVALRFGDLRPLRTWHGDQTFLEANLFARDGRYEKTYFRDRREFPVALLGATPLCAGYYHFITDLLPRLILGSRVARNAALLVPRDALTRTRHAFVDGFLRRAGVEMGRVEGLDVVPRRFARAASARASVGRLLFVDWATTRPDDDVAAWHLPPFAALHVVRAALGAAGRPPERRTVVVVLRRRAPTRRLAADAERAVLDAAERVASEFDLATTIFSDEAPADAAATLRLFRPAALVVGVHGAGLTNALFCARCALLELGLPNPHARYYAHLANATRSPYAMLPVAADGAAPPYAAREVGLADDPAAAMRALLVRTLRVS